MINEKYHLCWQIFQDFSEIDVDVYIAGCQGESTLSLQCSCIKFIYIYIYIFGFLFKASVVEQLEFGDFFSESVTKKRLFATVHDAVLYCLNHRGATSLTRYEPSMVRVDLFGQILI